MFKYFLLCFFTFNLYADPLVDKAQEIVHEAINNKNYVKLYEAIKILDESKVHSLEVLSYKVKLELTVNAMDDSSSQMAMDYNSVCKDLRKINKIKEIQFPDVLVKITSSKALEKAMCALLKNAKGQELYDRGTRVIYRTGNSTFNKYTISKAMPYYKLAEKKNFNDPELFRMYLDIYSLNSNLNWQKVYKYSKRFFDTNSKKNLPTAIPQRLYAISKFTLIPSKKVKKSDITEAILSLKKAKANGDKKSVEYISDLNDLLKDWGKNNTINYCDYLTTNRDINFCKGMSGNIKYCNYLTNNRDLNFCKGASGQINYCDYLSSYSDINKCKGMSGSIKYCDYLSTNHDINMCKGVSGQSKYCDYLSKNNDINMCKGASKK